MHSIEGILTMPNSGSFHLDKRAHILAAQGAGENDDELLDTRQLADELGVSRNWVENRRRSGDGPLFSVISNKRIRYRRDDVRSWLKERSHKRTSEYLKRIDPRDRNSAKTKRSLDQ
jgi:hypothetical protein